MRDIFIWILGIPFHLTRSRKMKWNSALLAKLEKRLAVNE